MRKQYHSRQTASDNYVWDVDRLVELTKSVKPERVPLADIVELDEVYWFSNSNPPTCRSVGEHAILIEETDLKYPIILSADGRVMDGMHRVVKALMKRQDDILAVRFEVDPEPDYIDVDVDSLPYE